MGDLTKGFSRSEFACECGCGFDTVDYELLSILEDSRSHFSNKYNCDISISITGPNRCIEHNETVQKKYVKDYVPYSSETQHLYAKAGDHKHYKIIDGKRIQIPPEEVYSYYDETYPDSKGVGLYSNRVHIDSRKTKARWGKKT